MGVPKFFRYISERYPCLSEIVKEYQIPEFDNLYLDMNGIIHMCSHPDDADPHFRITEEKIFADIFHYIEVLFRMIKPKRLFFMAVDGVAPRAKMNQQRARRFRSAKEAEKLEEKARARGEVLPSEGRFDSNCITPGTVFMAKLHEQLKYFVVHKISTDKLWRTCKVILSGQETPGEGEHKIMDYIRYMRSQPDYNPDTRHCLYGLDADLIMLGLCTHEPNFSLLREEVKFGKKSTKRKSSPEEITFYLLHLSLMREYLELEFDAVREGGVLKFGFDIEKVIDDWVLMGFLVGNDFIPHLPNLHIANGALPVLYKTYMEVLPTFDGYINECGTLNLERFEKFMKSLANIDLENFEEQYADLRYFEGKTGRRPDGKQRKSYKQKDAEEVAEAEVLQEESTTKRTVDSGLAALIESTELMYSDNARDAENASDAGSHDSGDDSDACNLRDDDMFKDEFEQHKQDYYRNKLEYSDVNSDVYKAQAEGYVRAIQWNLNYYYNGVCSWSWYYPHHYAPYMSDIAGFSDLKLEFDLGKPFLPYEQLLAVLPAASKSLLPEPYHRLMTEESSLIRGYYPEEFQTDLNGKRAEWEAVVLIPFIDERVLLEAMGPCNEQLSEEEARRNAHGPMLIYTYTETDLGVYAPPEHFVPVRQNHAAVVSLTIDDVHVPLEKLIKGAYPGERADTYYLGFPTLKQLEFTHSLEKASVKVHEHPSRGENMILRIVAKERKGAAGGGGDGDGDEPPSLDAVARDLLGSTIYVAWPHLIEALVVAVSDESFRYHSTGERGHYNVEEVKGKASQTWQMERDSITNYYMSRFGVDVGPTDVLLHVKVMVGRKYVFTSQCRATLEKQWARIVSAYPLQTIVGDISVCDGKYALYKDVEGVFPLGSTCFMLGQPHYGSMGEVKDSKESLKNGRIKVCMRSYEEPNLNHVRSYCEGARVRYMDLQAASAKSALSRNLFSRITGTIFVTCSRRKGGADDANKVNVGLNLKFTARNEEVPGYTQRKDGTWYYSEKAVGLVNEYNKFCPELFEHIQTNNENIYSVEELFPGEDGKEKLDEVTAWIKSQPFYSIEKRACGSSVLDPEVIAKLEEVMEHYSKKPPKDVGMQVKPHLLYKSELNIGNIPPDPTATFHLYDRVVNIRDSYTVPLGLRGTIVALHSAEKESEPVYDVLFDEAFTGGLTLNCSPGRGYRLPKAALINKSHGRRQFEEKTGKPGQIIQRMNANMNVAQQGGFYPPGQNSAFATWTNQIKPPLLQQNFAYNVAPRGFAKPNVFPPIPGGVMHLARQNNFAAAEGAKNETQQHTFQHQFNFANQQSKNVNVYNQNQNSKPGSSPQKQQQQRPAEGQVAKTSPHHHHKPTENTRHPRDTWRAPPDKNERPRVNTDYLKRMLKINAPPPPDTKSEPDCTEKSAVEIGSVKLPSSPYSSVQLLSYYQSNGLGCPAYAYFDLPNKTIQAQLVNPMNGQFVRGKPAVSKLEASEHVAAEVLKILLKMHNDNSLSPASIPAPPKTWCQSNKSQQKTTTAAVASQFVPLQAVRSQVSKRNCSNPEEKRDVTTKENDDNTKIAFIKEINVSAAPKVPSGEVIQKPRRERKMRIAANFEIKLEN